MRLSLTLHCDGFQRDCPNYYLISTDTDAVIGHTVPRLLSNAYQRGWDVRPIQVDDDGGALGSREETRAYCPDCAQRLLQWTAIQVLKQETATEPTNQ